MKALALLGCLGLALVPASAGASAGAPVVVAVVDSGVNADPALLVGGYNAFDGTTDTHDVYGHGSGVARVVADFCGGCRIMPVKIDDDTGTSSQAVIAAGIRWATDHGAAVINLSYGLAIGARSTRAVEAAVADAVAHGVTVSIAAMNDGTRDPRINPWASDSPGAIRVGAVDSDGQLLPSSNHGFWVDVGAPGTATSNSAPRVAAAAAVVIAAHPELGGRQVKAVLRRGCRPVAGIDVGWHCVLDVDGSLAAADRGPVPLYRLAVSRTGAGSVTADGAAIECGTVCADLLDRGTVVTLTARPARGYRFARWQGACRGTRRVCVIELRAAAAVTAVFVRV